MNEILVIKEIIDIIPLILEYLVPGFIFITIRNFSYSKDISKDKYFIIKSIVLSYIFIQTVYYIIKLLFINSGVSEDVTRYIFIFIIVALAILYVKLDIEKNIVSLLGNGKTVTEDCFDEVLNYKEGTTVRVYIDGGIVYTGSLIYYDDKFAGADRRIVIAGYNSYTYRGKILSEYYSDKSKIVILLLKDIKRIEAFK